MKKLSFALIITLLLTLLFSPAVSAEAIATESENNDTSVAADVITNGKIRGALGTTKDVDFYKFTADKDYFELSFGISGVNLSADPRDGWSVTIYDQDMVELLSYTTENSFATPRMPISGTIYVKVQATDDFSVYSAPVDVQYDIAYTNTADSTWESEYNETSITANAISANQVYHGSLQKAKDVDWFKSTSADYFNVTFNVNTTIDTSYAVNDGWKISLYDSSLALLTSFDVKTTGTSFNYPVTGDVYVKVEATDDFSVYSAPVHVYYDLKVNSFTDKLWETEYNDTSKTANTIKQGTTYTGNLMATKDVDYYKVKTTSKAFAIVFDIHLDEVDANAVKDGWKISVYPANSNNAICTFTADTLGTVQSITLPYAKGQYYYVKVAAADNFSVYSAPVGQTYHLSVVDASESHDWEVESRTADVKSATTLTEGAKIYGNLYAKGDADYYKCKVISGGTIDVKFSRDKADNDEGGYLVKVINSAGKEVASMKVNDSVSNTLKKVKVSKGTYYIVVTNAGWTAPGADINYNVSFKLTLAKPSVQKVTTTKNTFKITWNKRSDVSGYEIQYATNKNFTGAKTVKISSKSTSSYTIKNTSATKAYYIRLRTVAKDGTKTYYSPWSATSATVNNPTVKSAALSKNTLKVTWNKISGASGYEVQYATNKNFTKAKTVKISSKNTTSTSIKKTADNKTYYVRVRAFVKSGSTTGYSSWNNAPVVVTNSTTKKVTVGSTLKIEWNKNTGASGYQVQYATNKNFTKAKTVKIGSNSTTKTTVKGISSNKTYFIRVRAFVKSGSTTTYSAWSTTSVAVTNSTMKKVTAGSTLKIEWNKNTGASGYQVQYATNKNFTKAKTVKIGSNSTTKTTIKGISSNKTYFVRVRAFVKSGSTTTYSAWSTTSVAVTAPSVKKVTPNANTLKVFWEKNSNATNYEIQYSTSKNFTKAKTVKVSSKNASVTITNTSAKTTYFVRIRTVVKASTTNYSPWSAAYSIKTK